MWFDFRRILEGNVLLLIVSGLDYIQCIARFERRIFLVEGHILFAQGTFLLGFIFIKPVNNAFFMQNFAFVQMIVGPRITCNILQANRTFKAHFFQPFVNHWNNDLDLLCDVVLALGDVKYLTTKK